MIRTRVDRLPQFYIAGWYSGVLGYETWSIWSRSGMYPMGTLKRTLPERNTSLIGCCTQKAYSFYTSNNSDKTETKVYRGIVRAHTCVQQQRQHMHLIHTYGGKRDPRLRQVRTCLVRTRLYTSEYYLCNDNQLIGSTRDQKKTGQDFDLLYKRIAPTNHIPIRTKMITVLIPTAVRRNHTGMPQGRGKRKHRKTKQVRSEAKGMRTADDDRIRFNAQTNEKSPVGIRTLLID